MQEEDGPFFEYSQAELCELCARDKRLGQAIERIGPIRRRVYPDAYGGIVRAITGQQVSSKAHAAIWERFTSEFPGMDPEVIATNDACALARRCGLSRRKAEYILRISMDFSSGRLSHAKLDALADQEFRDHLTAWPGIGRWTADMVLIFTFQRKNVLSFEDLAIRRGMARLYGHERLTAEIFQSHLYNYRPNATLAGLYLWEIAGRDNKKPKTGA